MKTIFALIVVLGAARADAGCNVAVAHNQVVTNIVTAVAIPVGVPIATYSPVAYSFGGDSSAAVVAELRQLRAEFRAMASGNVAAAFNPYPVTTQRCASCHSGGDAAAFAKFPFKTLDDLTGDQRTQAARAILKDKMPPKRGVQLTPDENGRALLELLDVPKVAARPIVRESQVSPPPAPPMPVDPQAAAEHPGHGP